LVRIGAISKELFEVVMSGEQEDWTEGGISRIIGRRRIGMRRSWTRTWR
jgi:hypothetical protein